MAGGRQTLSSLDCGGRHYLSWQGRLPRCGVTRLTRPELKWLTQGRVGNGRGRSGTRDGWWRTGPFLGGRLAGVVGEAPGEMCERPGGRRWDAAEVDGDDDGDGAETGRLEARRGLRRDTSERRWRGRGYRWMVGRCGLVGCEVGRGWLQHTRTWLKKVQAGRQA